MSECQAGQEPRVSATVFQAKQLHLIHLGSPCYSIRIVINVALWHFQVCQSFLSAVGSAFTWLAKVCQSDVKSSRQQQFVPWSFCILSGIEFCGAPRISLLPTVGCHRQIRGCYCHTTIHSAKFMPMLLATAQPSCQWGCNRSP